MVGLSGAHPGSAWMIEHAAANERLRGKACHHEIVEFSEKVHDLLSKRNKSMDENLEVSGSEGFFLEKLWRTGGVAIGTWDGIL